jgi:hypothetical protein
MAMMLSLACLAGSIPPQPTDGPGIRAQSGLAESDLVAGLKEALAVGTRAAVQLVSQIDGYFANEAIKILMPEQIRTVAETLGRIGFQKQVDEFVLSMNRAAEKAAPAALDIFVEAVKAMTFEDAKNILSGEETAATDYFQSKTSEKIYTAFRPIVSASMEEVGVTQAFKQIMDKYTTLPFVQEQSLDLDHYVTERALNGLFYMVGEEEKKIRTDPAARVTDLLKSVFK